MNDPAETNAIFVLILLQEAQQRLEENHREKVTRVMKDWSDLEERYQDMRLADPKSAQTFKQKMTARFQVVYFAPTFLPFEPLWI